MRKIALSLAVVAASGAYVWSQWDGSTSADPLAALSPLGSQAPIGSAEARALDPPHDDPKSDDLRTGSIGERQPAFVKAPQDFKDNVQPAAEDVWSDDNEDAWSDDNEDAWSDDEGEENDSEFARPAPPTGEAFASPRSPAPTAMAAPDMAAAPETALSIQVAQPVMAPTSAARPPELTALPIAPVTPVDPIAQPSAIVEARLPRPRPAYQAPVASPAYQPSPPVAAATLTRVAMRVPQNGRYQDGTYTGPAVDAFYGLIQIQAIVQGGRLVDINVLQYPSDRRLSVRINRYALPRLRDEVVSAQNANVDIISGATLTSEAFIRSIRTALRGAAGA